MPDLTKGIQERLARGRARLKDGSAKRSECMEFWRGNQYVYRSPDNILVSQSTITAPDSRGKPPWVARTSRNLLIDVVAHEVSAATQRVPNYEIDPSTSEPEDVSAARLAGKVARYGYDKWDLRSVIEQVVTYAVVADEGFAWPFWDSSVGPYIGDENGNPIGRGEIGVRVFGGNEVFWEPGLKFRESPWHGVQQARTVQAVQEMEGFIKGTKLTPDAAIDQTGTNSGRDSQHSKLILVTDYLERPSASKPEGQWLITAGNALIADPRPYPYLGLNGEYVDEPVLHQLAYIVDPDSDRDMGLVRHLLDAMRTINDCVNKEIMWKNLAMNPQLIIQNGVFAKGQRLTNEPGAVYNIQGSTLPATWRPVPQMPQALAEMKQEAMDDMAQIAAQNDIPANVASARGIQALLERDQNRRAAFVGNLAEFHSRLMRHCLCLVQNHYTEDRLLKLRGRYGPETIDDFLGSQLRSQVDVTVLAGDLMPRTRASQEEKILGFADRGWISPEAAMAAINNGTAEGLIDSYEQDIARANLIIEKVRRGPQALFDVPPRRALPSEKFTTDPATGMQIQKVDPVNGAPIEFVEGWMPRPFDNAPVQKAIFEDYMKTSEWDDLDPASQEALMAVYSQLLTLEAEQAARAAAMQMQMAQDLGMSNATRPPNKQMPDQSSPNGSSSQNQTSAPTQ